MNLIIKVPAEGAYLYDAVYVYARALNDTLKNKQNVTDGRVIFSYIKNRYYKSNILKFIKNQLTCECAYY